MTSRYFLATINHPDGSTIDEEEWGAYVMGHIQEIWPLRGDITFIVMQAERGDSTDKYHIQMMICLDKPVRKHWLIRNLSVDFVEIHWESPTWGNRQQLAQYCRWTNGEKPGYVYDETHWEYGVLDSQGRTHGLQEVKDLLDGGSGMLVVAQEHFGTWIRHYKGLQVYEDQYSVPATLRAAEPRLQPVLYHLYGPSGFGKSSVFRMMIEMLGWIPYEPPIGGSTLYFDEAQGSDVLFLDDFYGGIPFNQLMRLLDPGRQNLQIKGGNIRKPAWKAIFMTTNVPLNELYDKVSDIRKEGLMRRFRDFGRSVLIPFRLFYDDIQRGLWPVDLFGPMPTSWQWGEPGVVSDGEELDSASEEFVPIPDTPTRSLSNNVDQTSSIASGHHGQTTIAAFGSQSIHWNPQVSDLVHE